MDILETGCREVGGELRLLLTKLGVAYLGLRWHFCSIPLVLGYSEAAKESSFIVDRELPSITYSLLGDRPLSANHLRR